MAEFQPELRGRQRPLPPSREWAEAVELVLLNLGTDIYEHSRRFEVHGDTIVLIEGVFLFRPELVNYLDVRIYLTMSLQLAMKRGIERDRGSLGNDVERRYREKYMRAQRTYIDVVRPEELADIVIDNNDLEHPILIRRR